MSDGPVRCIAAGAKVSKADRDVLRKFFLGAHEKKELEPFLVGRGIERYLAHEPGDYLALSGEMRRG